MAQIVEYLSIVGDPEFKPSTWKKKKSETSFLDKNRRKLF
jgi:hypothetical protein